MNKSSYKEYLDKLGLIHSLTIEDVILIDRESLMQRSDCQEEMDACRTLIKLLNNDFNPIVHTFNSSTKKWLILESSDPSSTKHDEKMFE